MKILMLLASRFPPDSRVEKEATSLSEEGHEVHLLCYRYPGQEKLETTPHFTVHRFTASGFHINKLSALALVIPFYFSRWQKEAMNLHARYSFDAIHVHDLPLSRVGYFFKKKYGCKLILDQHEFYSDWIKQTAHMNTRIGKLVGFFSNWEKYERTYLPLSDMVITVSEPLRENYLKKYGINAGSLITVPNTPTQKIYHPQNVDKRIIEKFKPDFVIFYAGGIDILRGIDTAIIALKQILEDIPNAKLLLCGKIVKPYNPFKTAKEQGVEKALQFEGWIDENQLPSYIAASDVCFFTPPVNRDEINKTIATKIYQYTIMNKPIIVSDAEMMKKFVEDHHLGISIPSGNAGEFARAVVKIHRKEWSRNKPAANALIWEETVKPLCAGYRLLNEKAQTGRNRKQIVVN